MKQHLLHADSLLTLYKAQVTPLAWMSGARCHLNLLDKVQRRAEHLISGTQQYQHHSNSRWMWLNQCGTVWSITGVLPL